MKCKICENNSVKIFSKKILQKHNTSYYCCENCGFVQTDQPFWLPEAYSSAITALDIGILKRNQHLLLEIPKLIDTLFPDANKFLDYAGGYGLFVRSMRDLGFDFFRQDRYCDNIFAKHFDIDDSKIDKFDVVTAFEVFEHLENPLNEIADIFEFGDNLIFSTDLVPEKEIVDWIYIAPETGQHISFYTEKAISIIAEKFSKYYYRKKNLHILSKESFSEKRIDFALKDIGKYRKFFGLKKEYLNFRQIRQSFLEDDYKKIQNILKENI